MILTMIGTISFAQVIFQIQAPSTPVPLQNTTYPLEWADPAGGDWATPDLNIPANSVTAALQFVDDGDLGNDPTYGFPASQDACSNFTQPSLVGKIAVLYRGTCQFGYKAAVAENAGAVAVIIINHTGAAIGMAGGDSGLAVTVPVIMISEQDGATLEAAITAGTITQAFIGNKFGIFADDLGSKKGDVLRARRFSNIAALSQNASEFSVPVGAWVRNFGNQTKTGATLAATIDNGTQIYNQSANIPTIVSGDSVWVSLPTFSQSSYPVGMYTMEYTITTNPNADGEPSDNSIDASFMISDSLYAYGRLDAVTNNPLSPAGFRAGTFTTDWEGCFAFQDANASRLKATGMTFTATTSSTDSLNNEFVEARVYEWNDVFTDVTDAGLGFANLNQVDAAYYVYGSDLQDSAVFVPYTTPIALLDNQRYLFCLNTGSLKIFAGYDSQVDYTSTQDDGTGTTTNGSHLQPSIPGSSDGTYFLNGFGLSDAGPISISIHMDVVTSVEEAINEVNMITYPNPTANEINIPVGDRNGAATIEIFDIAGKLVISNAVTFNKYETLKVNVANISNGSYLGKMTFEDGTTAKFNVVVTR